MLTRTGVIIFSKDRAMQLDALLQSIECYASMLLRPRVIYTYSNADFRRGYHLLREHLGCSVHWIDQSGASFQEVTFHTLTTILRSGGCQQLMFLVDDDVFFLPLPEVTISKGFCYAPRLGANTTWCYTENHAQILGQCAYAYPYSLDGNIFDLEEIVSLVHMQEFRSPNELEDKLAVCQHPMKIVYGKHSCLVGIPHNVVGSYTNRSGGGSAEALNKLFLSGHCIDLDAMDFTAVKGCHQEIAYVFKGRV